MDTTYQNELNVIFIPDITQLIDHYALSTTKEQFVQLTSKSSDPFVCQLRCSEHRQWESFTMSLEGQTLYLKRNNKWERFDFDKWWATMERSGHLFEHDINCRVPVLHFQKRINAHWNKMILHAPKALVHPRKD